MTKKLRNRWPTALLALMCGAASVLACSSNEDVDPGPEEGTQLLGGGTTVFDVSGEAYSFPARNLDDPGRDQFSLGNHFFRRNWVTAPASISGNDGLGPTFNATSCDACHFKDGRGAPPGPDDKMFVGLLIRMSVPGTDEHGGPLPDPAYGNQFNHNAILGVPSEGKAAVTYEEVPGTYADGEAYSLRRPTYAFTDLAFGPFGAGSMISPRVAQAMIGLGLLEAVPEETVLALADPDDRDGDGISGRANVVWNQRAQKATLGRFGWKANQPTIEQQTAAAFVGDIGITSKLDPLENCPAAQTACASAISGGTPGSPELDDQKMTAITSYSRTIAVPSRRDWERADIRHGEALFSQLGCASCHATKLHTGTVDGFPSISNQTIRPFTDLLLHDMGPDLADNRPDFLATGVEWRTAPLWGLGLIQTVNKHEMLLHDGRARGVAEAILWHGGEAQKSKEAFKNLPKTERETLLAFLEDL